MANNTSLRPIDVAVNNAQARSHPLTFTITATDIGKLLSEAVQLSTLIATEVRDLEAIRADLALRSQKLNNIHEEVMSLIKNEYRSRERQADLIHENVRLMIQAGQYKIAQEILNRLTDILADSPLKMAMEYRLRNSS